MTRFKHFISNNWDILVVIALTLILFLTFFLPFILYNSLDKFDTPGLLSQSWFMRNFIFPDFQGWNPFFYAGYPQGTLYPPLFSYLVAFISKVTPSIDLAYKVVITLAGLLIPYSIYQFSKKIYKIKLWSILNTLLLLIVLVISPGFLGFNFTGLLDYGLGPNFFSIPFVFFYLSELFSEKRSIAKLSILLGILILTHLLSALTVALVTLGYFVTLNRKIQLRIFIAMIVTVFLTASWTIPFLYFNKFSASGLPTRISIVYPLASLALSGLILLFAVHAKQFTKEAKLLSLLKAVVPFAVLGILDSVINVPTTKFSIPLIHPFRLQIYALLLSASGLVFLARQFHPFFLCIARNLKVIHPFKPAIHIPLMLGLFSLLLLASVVFRLNPKGVPEVTVPDDLSWDGRIMRVYKVTEVLDQSRAVIDRSLMNANGSFATMGLLKESSFLAPYFQSLAKSVDPSNFNWNELDSYYIEDKQIPEEKTNFLMNLLWVKNLFAIKTSQPNCNDFELLASFKSNSAKEGVVNRDMYICKFLPSQNSKFIEVINTQPEVITGDWQAELDKWWLSADTSLFTDKDFPAIEPPSHLAIQPSDIQYLDYNFSSNFQSLTINNSSGQKLPILIKMSYFPKWKAYDDNNLEIPIYRISPSLMAVVIGGSVTLRYGRTPVEWITIWISIATFFSMVFYSLAKVITARQKHAKR